MKKLIGFAATLIGATALTQAAYAALPATYFTNCAIKTDQFVPYGNCLHKLNDSIAWNENTIYFSAETDQNDRFVGEKYFEAYLHQTAEVSSLEMWNINMTWNVEHQTIRKVKIKYFDTDEQDWKWVNDGEDFNVNFMLDSGWGIYRAVIELPEPIETHRVRIYLAERTKGDKGDIRLDEFLVNGTPVDGAKYRNGNILYQAIVSSTNNASGIVSGIADGKMDLSSEICTQVGTEDVPYEITFDFGENYYEADSFEMISEYLNQGITDLKFQYDLAGHWVDAKAFTFDMSANSEFGKGTQDNPVLYGGTFDEPMVSNRFKAVITGCAGTDSFRIGEMIVSGKKADAKDMPSDLSEKVTMTREGSYLKAESFSDFKARAILINAPQNTTAEIGYFDGENFVSLMRDVALQAGENFIVTDFNISKRNLAVKFADSAENASLTIYGKDDFSALDQALEALKKSKKYSEYTAVATEIDGIADSVTKAYYQQLLENVLKEISETQSVNVSNFAAKERTFFLDGTVFAEDESDVTIEIISPKGNKDTQTLKARDGKISGTLPVRSEENGEFTVTVKAYDKDLTAKLTTRAVYDGAKFESFEIDGVRGKISGSKITLTLPAGSTLKNRVPVFTLSEGDVAYYNGNEIKSGETKIDFDQDVTFRVVAESQRETEYTVSVDLQKKVTGGGGGGGSSSKNNTTSKTPDLIIPQSSVLTPKRDKTFSDLTEDHWAYRAIMKLSENQTVSGTTENTFEPERSVTREEFTVMLARAKKILPANNRSEFADAKEHWSTYYIAAMTEAGFVHGVDERNFGIGMPMTREDACTLIFRTLGDESDAAESNFSDEAQIASYAKPAVAFMKNKGYVSGYRGEFMPKKQITRAEAAQMIANVYFAD